MKTPSCQSFFFNKVDSQVFCYEFFKFFKNTFFTEHLWKTASGYFPIQLFARATFLQGLPEALFVNPFSLKSFSFEYRGFGICSIEQIELRRNFNRFADFLGS